MYGLFEDEVVVVLCFVGLVVFEFIGKNVEVLGDIGCSFFGFCWVF